MNKNKLLLLLALLMTAATGAWADETYPIVYDFEAAANANENPANKNGSAANGQKFYGWESETYKDRDRQDYKGYEYAEGSKLPEVCHVWRRSDRFPGNVAGNGGLKCPSNKEMAVDGLTEGLTVTIIYDATDAKDKEIVWAIGDGSSESLGEPRAKATINGAEAVPGTTTIKSGDVITVTKVTPAANGSGYIVFAVKKDMVIKKIIIDEAKAASGYTVSLNDGTENPTTWTASTDGTNFGALPIGGLKGDGTETVTLKYNGRLKVKSVTATTDAAPAATLQSITVGKGSSELSSDKIFYYMPGDTYRQALAREENQTAGDLGWGYWEGSGLTTVFFKEVSTKAWDMAIDGDSNFASGQGSSTITLDTVIDTTGHTFQFVNAQ